LYQVVITESIAILNFGGIEMVINEEMKSVIENSAFLTIVTMCPDGSPHPIIVGGGTVEGDNVSVGVYAKGYTGKY